MAYEHCLFGGVVNYYNEFDPKAAAWLQELINQGQIPPGVVDTRSIEDVKPSELTKYTQCHFFAGIGGWPLALRLAGIPDDTPLWTGSCPCQPFSASGKGGGFDDERHLWPSWAWLISVCNPPVIYGEQVAAKAAEPWIDLVHADLEAMGYAFGCIPFPSASVGAPHIRDRAYWVAYANEQGLEGWGSKTPVHEPDCSEAWKSCVVVRDQRGDARIIEPSTRPLVNGVPARVGRLRGYGNAINPIQAAEFIKACAVN